MIDGGGGVKLKRSEIVFSSSSITAGIVLTEPFVLLRGFRRAEQNEAPPTMLRGSLVLQVHKPTKIKSIQLEFKGTCRTEWPEGIPPLKVETHETTNVFYHGWPFFNHTSPLSEPLGSPMIHVEGSSGLNSTSTLSSSPGNTLSSSSTLDMPRRGRSRTLEVKDIFQAVSTIRSNSPQIRSRSRAGSMSDKSYKLFSPAEYVYNFELALPSILPETSRCNFGFVRYMLEAQIERQGTFKSNLTGTRDVLIIRGLSVSSLEFSEPIVIDRSWEDILKYEIVVAGKVFPIGGKIPLAVSLIPLDKAGCHRIRVYITEHCEYYCRNRKVHRVEPTRRFMLLDKQPKDGIQGNLLNEGSALETGAVSLDLSAEILKNFPNRRDILRPNISSNAIKVHHWIKISLRLSRPHPTTPNARKTYEISIDSPVMLVDPRVTKATTLPEYLPQDDENIETSIAFQAHNLQSTSAAAFFGQPSLAPPPIDADQAPPHEFPPEYKAGESIQSYQSRYRQFAEGDGGSIAGDHVSEIYWEEDETPTPQMNVRHVSDDEEESPADYLRGSADRARRISETTLDGRSPRMGLGGHLDPSPLTSAHPRAHTPTLLDLDESALSDDKESTPVPSIDRSTTPATSVETPSEDLRLAQAAGLGSAANLEAAPKVDLTRAAALPEVMRRGSMDPMDPLYDAQDEPEPRPYTAPSATGRSSIPTGSRHSSMGDLSRSSSVSSTRFYRQTSLVSVDLIDQSIARYRSRGGALSETQQKQRALDPDAVSIRVSELGDMDRVPLLDDQSEYDLADFDDDVSLRSRCPSVVSP